MKTNDKIEIGDQVQTPEGVGEIREDTVFGQYRIKIEGVGSRWYFPEDIQIIKKNAPALAPAL